MDWLRLAGMLIAKVPVERILFPEPDHTKAYEDFLNRSIDKLDGKPTEAELEAELRAAYGHIAKVKGWVEGGKVAEAVVADKVKKIVGK